MATVTLTGLFFVIFFKSIHEAKGIMTLNVNGGIVASAFTPFLKNGLVNFDEIPSLARGYKKNGIEYVVLVAYSGEGPSMNLTDRKAVVAKWLEVGKPLKIKFFVEVGGLPIFDSVELVKFCYELKVEATLILPVITYKGTLEEIIHDFQLISDAAPDLPFIYEDLGFATNPTVPSGEIFAAALKQICNFAGIMTTMDTALMLKATQPLQNMTVMIIGHDQIAATFANKFNASIDTAPNLFPKKVLAIARAYRNCDYEKGEAAQADLSSHIAAINNLNHTVIDVTSRGYLENQKEAYRLICGKDLGIRIPLVKPTRAVTLKIASNLQRLKVELKGYP